MRAGKGSTECMHQVHAAEIGHLARRKALHQHGVSRTTAGARVLLACLAASGLVSCSAFVTTAHRSLSLSQCSSLIAPSNTCIAVPFHTQGRRSRSKPGQARLGSGTAPIAATSREAQRAIGAEGVAVVTGGNRGIGFEVCRQLAGLGYTVVLAARSSSKGEAAARDIREAGGDCRFLECDVKP